MYKRMRPINSLASGPDGFSDNQRCNMEKPRKCNFCLQYRESQMFRRWDNEEPLSTCTAWQYASCHIYASQHPESEKPLRNNARSRLALKWYCMKGACQEAFRCAQREQKKTKTESDLTTAKPKTGPRGKK